MMPRTVNWNDVADDFTSRMSRSSLRLLARKLEVSVESLQSLEVGWSERDGAWTFPERDAQCNVIGILRRYRDGRKKLITGGKRGLYIPRDWQSGTGPIYVPEGASDVAALLTHGLRAIGRPACTGGVKLLRELLIGSDVDVIIVGENDEKPDGRWPGRDGAMRVATELARDFEARVRWTLPPSEFKDVRSYLTGDTKHGT